MEAAHHTGRDDPPILTGRVDTKENVVKVGFLVAVGGAAVVIAGLSGCGSDEKKAETTGETSSAASAEGKTTVTIDGQDQQV